jgi:hypothetical protein
MQSLLRQKLDQMNSGTPNGQTPASPIQPFPTTTPTVQAPPPIAPATLGPVIDDATRAKDQELLRQKLAALKAGQLETPPPPPAIDVKAKWSPNANTKPVAPAVEKAFPAVPAPSVAPGGPPPGSKEARLAQLTALYLADKITPLEYHTQRAKILAEP